MDYDIIKVAIERVRATPYKVSRFPLNQHSWEAMKNATGFNEEGMAAHFVRADPISCSEASKVLEAVSEDVRQAPAWFWPTMAVLLLWAVLACRLIAARHYTPASARVAPADVEIP